MSATLRLRGVAITLNSGGAMVNPSTPSVPAGTSKSENLKENLWTRQIKIRKADILARVSPKQLRLPVGKSDSVVSQVVFKL